MSRILIVDDSEILNHLLREFLIGHGYEVDSAGSAEEAYQAVKSHKPDLLILDVQLPDIGGFELCKHFRSQPNTRNVPIIMISATAVKTTDKIQGLQFGADDYLSKPFEMPELLERVRAVMRRNIRGQSESAPTMPEASLPQADQEAPAARIADTIRAALCDPRKLPANPAPVALLYVITMAFLLLCGLAAGTGVATKPLLVCLMAVTSWGFLVSVLVVSCTVLGIDLNWRPGAHLFSLASLPILLKLAGGTVMAAWTSLSPFLFSASPGLFFSSAPFLVARLDLYELWTIGLVYLFVLGRPKATKSKSLAVAVIVWLSAIGVAFCIQRLGGAL